MPRKSRRTVQRAEPAIDERTSRPPTGHTRKMPKKEPKIRLLQLLHFATPLDYLCLSIAVPCAAGTGFLQATRTTRL